MDYDLLVAQVTALLADESDFIANAANFAAFVYNEIPDLNWGRGVCGAAFMLGTTVVVDDVHAFADHIACDSASASEIVVPLRAGNTITGVFDIDSPRIARFSAQDRAGIERLVQAFLKSSERELMQ